MLDALPLQFIPTNAVMSAQACGAREGHSMREPAREVALESKHAPLSKTGMVISGSPWHFGAEKTLAKILSAVTGSE